jgi:hypothetical protein
MEVRNDSEGLVELFLEPLGEDRWLTPGETFTIRSDYEGDEEPFEVTDERGLDGTGAVVVWPHACGEVEVFDDSGALVECGHQRPGRARR